MEKTHTNPPRSPWYSQCLPGTEDDPLPYAEDVPIQTSTFQTTITVTGGSRPTVVTTYITYLTPEPTPDPSSYVVISGVTYTYVSDSPSTRYPGVLPRRNAVITGTPAGAHAATPTTLQDGQYWIRAVASPNFHKYLQTSPANEVGVAVLGSSKTAGQFSVADGQLVEWTGEGGSPLYLNVEKPADLTQRTLATWFNTTKNEFGTFVFQGDALTWSTPEINRQNLAAWLVCKNQALFINTGAYAYQTPEGCADQTVRISFFFLKSLGLCVVEVSCCWGDDGDIIARRACADSVRFSRSTTTTTRPQTTEELT